MSPGIRTAPTGGPRPACQSRGALPSRGREGQAVASRNSILSGLETRPPSGQNQTLVARRNGASAQRAVIHRRCGEWSYRPKQSRRYGPRHGHRDRVRPSLPSRSEETTMDVGVWLRSLGLGQYEAAFRDNEIDGELLPKLTVDDLKDLGVDVVGHRRRIMSAIEALGGQLAAQAEAPKTAPAQSAVHTSAAAGTAERRQLTVMFCDLVGSTAISARLDPEDMREVIRAYQDACSGAVARYDGFVAKFMGDGVLAYFGFPRAHEEDAERAVRAGLDIVAVVAKLDTPAKESLKVRIGVATGIVVVGDVVGQGSAQEQAVVGETPNLAARLQALAGPGSAVIAESTRRLLAGQGRQPRQRWRESASLDAHVKRRHAQTSQLDLDSQDSRFSLFLKGTPLRKPTRRSGPRRASNWCNIWRAQGGCRTPSRPILDCYGPAPIFWHVCGEARLDRNAKAGGNSGGRYRRLFAPGRGRRGPHPGAVACAQKRSDRPCHFRTSRAGGEAHGRRRSGRVSQRRRCGALRHRDAERVNRAQRRTAVRSPDPVPRRRPPRRRRRGDRRRPDGRRRQYRGASRGHRQARRDRSLRRRLPAGQGEARDLGQRSRPQGIEEHRRADPGLFARRRRAGRGQARSAGGAARKVWPTAPFDRGAALRQSGRRR